MHRTNTPDEILAGRLAGATWGHLAADAAGVPYEFGQPMDPAAVTFRGHGTHDKPAGTWSDDGALMLALLDALLPGNGTPGGIDAPVFDLEAQGATALAWQRNGAYTPDGDVFDIGGTTSHALSRLRSGVPAVDAGPADDRACGNGSLMRILPLGLVYRDASPAALIGMATQASRVTHGHPRCQVACAVYTLAVAELLRGTDPKRALASAFAHCERDFADGFQGEEGLRVALEELRAYRDHEHRGRGYVLDAFWSAWDAFTGSASYEETVRRAIAFGHDTDTTAAIAGGLAGAYWGWDAIPKPWLRAMQGKAVAQSLVDRLVRFGTRAKTSSSSELRVNDLRLDALPGFEGIAGRAGITFLVGKKHDGYTGLHWRDLDADLGRLRELGVDVLVQHVEDSELERCGVPDLETVMAEQGPGLIRYPIRDPRTPTDMASYRALVADLLARVRAGQSVAIACRGGMDRSGMTAACLLVEGGVEPAQAIAWVQRHRRDTITLRDQQAVVHGWQRP